MLLTEAGLESWPHSLGSLLVHLHRDSQTAMPEDTWSHRKNIVNLLGI